MFMKTMLTLASLAMAVNAYAGTATQNLSVTAVVANTCYIDSSSIVNVSFGNIDGLFSSNTEASGSFGVQCTNAANYSIQFDGGQNSNTGGARLYDGSSQYIQYGLYVDSAYSNPWTTSQSQIGNGLAQSYTIYGLIPSGQSPVSAASFSDTQQITVSF
jgi:spore coat protein U-like protein